MGMQMDKLNKMIIKKLVTLINSIYLLKKQKVYLFKIPLVNLLIYLEIEEKNNYF